MRVILFLAGLFFLVPAVLLGADPRQPAKIILDTDIGGDVDDALALAMIHTGISRGECDLLAVTITKTHPLAAEYTQMLNAWYGRPDIPVGLVRDGVARGEGSGYLKKFFRTPR